jgi:hypothetical protein
MESKFKKILLVLKNNYKDEHKKYNNLLQITKLLNTKDIYNNNDFVELIRYIEKYLLKKLINKKFIKVNLFNEISNGNIDFFQNIIIPKQYLYIYNEKGNTLLHHCIENNDITIFKLLYNTYCMELNIVNLDKLSLTIYSLSTKEYDIYEYIVQPQTILKNYYILSNKINHNHNNVDIPLIIHKLEETKENVNIEFINKYVDINTKIGYNNMNFQDLFNNISITLKNTYNTYIDIIKEELNYYNSNYSCYNNILELLVYNLIPFIDYCCIDNNKKHNLYISSENIIKNELNFIIKNKNYKKKIQQDYINTNLFTKKYIYKILNSFIH